MIAGSGKSIVLCGVDFGWGSSGKLCAIMRSCRRKRPAQRFVILGTKLGRTVLSDEPIEAWHADRPEDSCELRELLDHYDVAAGLVVLDPRAADVLETAGCPTVFVDSLPYLWTKADPLPFDVTAYCAQMCPALPQPAWAPLRRIARLHWVEGINATVPLRPRDRHLAVLNVGGLHSPANPSGNPNYLRLILEPALRACEATGFHTVRLCGNIRPSDQPSIANDLSLTVRAGALPHGEFLELLAKAGLLMTSPGLTTLLEAGAHRTATVCLPAQNLSQIFNGDRFASSVDAKCRVGWPPAILDRSEIEHSRLAGEDAGLAVIDNALGRLDPRAVHPWLLDQLIAAIRHTTTVTRWDGLTTDAGARGADQIAALVLDLLDRSCHNILGDLRGVVSQTRDDRLDELR
ncbi:MAG: hydroxymethylcytosylglucuronate/cytosylglucuronate synthase [Pseudonocardiaceae bacterium]